MSHFHSLTVSRIQRETADCVAVTFDVPAALTEAYQFKAGQYLTLRTHLDDGQELRRSYSICTAPHEGSLTVAVKKVPNGRFSTYANEQLRIGDSLDVMTPMGSFTLPTLTTPSDNTAQQYVFFASGSGITPIIALIKHILHQQPNSQVTLFYGNKNFESIIFREQIEALKNTHLQTFTLQHILSRESLGSPLFKGRLNEEKCRQYAKIFFNPTQVAHYYICGPQAMIDSLSNTLQQLGASYKSIHTEIFTTPTLSGQSAQKANLQQDTDTNNSKGFESQINVTIDGNSFDFVLYSKGESILDAAQRAGADLPFACKGGVCSTCKAKVLKGQVNMDINYALEHDEVAEGYVLTCQAHPLTEEVIISFDEH